MVRNIHFTYFANNPTETKPSATRKAVTLFGVQSISTPFKSTREAIPVADNTLLFNEIIVTDGW